LVKITRRNLLAASAAFAVTPALAQPAKNMTLVVPFPPGGSTDALARLLQSHLQTRLGRTVLVENKSGAAGSLGAIQVAKSAPDGATFLVTFDFARGDPLDPRKAGAGCREGSAAGVPGRHRALTSSPRMPSGRTRPLPT
jgi:hypothetical protein